MLAVVKPIGAVPKNHHKIVVYSGFFVLKPVICQVLRFVSCRITTRKSEFNNKKHAFAVSDGAVSQDKPSVPPSGEHASRSTPEVVVNRHIQRRKNPCSRDARGPATVFPSKPCGYRYSSALPVRQIGAPIPGGVSRGKLLEHPR